MGEKGESRFREICADAKLVCNQSNRDRNGWDFIVEFPFDEMNHGQSLDSRPAPLSCTFQVKTVWMTSNTVQLRLSAAERLAKNPNPTFIYVFRVNEDLGFETSFLIHVSGENLSAILKRLRKEQAKGTSKINNKTITFNIKNSGEEIPASGDCLRDKITDLCGSINEDYIAGKSLQIKNLGFEPHRYEGKMTFDVGGYNELVDTFLGLRKAKVSNFQTFETRFGIKLPTTDSLFTEGTVEITPQPSDQCRILVTSDASNLPSVFMADVFLVPIPNLPAEHRKILIKSPFIEMLVSLGDKSINLQADDKSVTSMSLAIAEWVNYFRFRYFLEHGNATLTITPQKAKLGSAPISLNKNPGSDDSAYFLRLLSNCEKTQLLMTRVGISEKIIKFDDLITSLKHIERLGSLLSENEGDFAITFKSEISDKIELPEDVETLFVNFFPIADTTIGYCLQTEMHVSVTDRQTEWKSKRAAFKEVQELHNFPDSYNQFADSMKHKYATLAVVINQPAIDMADVEFLAPSLDK